MHDKKARDKIRRSIRYTESLCDLCTVHRNRRQDNSHLLIAIELCLRRWEDYESDDKLDGDHSERRREYFWK